MHRAPLRTAVPVTALLCAATLALASPAHAAGSSDLYASVTAAGAPGTVTYRPFFGNAGPDRAAGTVTAVLRLPAQTTGATIDLSGCAYDNTAKTVTCDLTGMPDGQGFVPVVTAKINPLAVGTLTATATITGADPDPDTTNNSASVSCTALTGLAITC
ncbi:hypothetical protein [Streptomyces sp. NPDC002185]|uniref:hypothetical protein n=1 Tax=unclassified Streptomyces TaxID=2593676 RepID=UPI0036BA3C13